MVLLCACRGRATTRGHTAPDAAPVPSVAARFEACARQSAAERAPAPLRWAALELRARDGVLEPTVRQATPSRLLLGVLADTKEALPATLENVARLVGRLRALGATGVLVLGGLDQRFEGIRAVLEKLHGLPVMGLPGDRESRSGWQAAVEGLQPRGVDLTRVRAVILPGASLIGVPGYHLPHHLFAKEQGCSYSREDLLALTPVALRLPGPRLLVAHGPPRGQGSAAVDRAFGEVNIGDPLLRELMRQGDIRFGVFAHVHEAAGHATTRDGRPVAEGAWSEELLLNVGSADSVPHDDLQGRFSRGTAALLEISGSRARYQMLRAEDTSAARPRALGSN